MKQIDVETADGAILKVRRHGSGAPLVLVSGLGGTAAFWDPAIDILAAECEIVTLDQRGIAGATRGTAPVSIARLAEDVLTVCDALDLTRAAFLGHSTGGCIVQTIAATRPERVDRVALSAAWLSASKYLTKLFEFRLSLLAQDPKGYAESAALLSYPPEWLEADWRRFQGATASPPFDSERQAIVAERIRALLEFDGTAQVGAISADTLIIGAQDDMIVPAFHQHELRQHLPGAALAMLPVGGHFYPVTQTQRFAQVVSDWMRLQTGFNT